MINIRDCIYKYHLSIIAVCFYPNYVILYGKKNQYLLKNRNTDSKRLFSYFDSIQYPYYLSLLNDYGDFYELYPYYDEQTDDIHLKVKVMLQALCLLHGKTIYTEELSDDEFLKIYDTLKEKINHCFHYYLELRDSSEQSEFRADYYLFLKNSSKLFHLLFLAKEYLESWYQNKMATIRKVFSIHNLALNNFCFCKKSFFIDYQFAYSDCLIADLVSFYKENALTFEISSLIDYYWSKIEFSKSELLLFYSSISIPDEIILNDNIYENTVKLHYLIEYIDKTIVFLEENKKNEETD